MNRYQRHFVRLTDAERIAVAVEAESELEANHLTWLWLLRNHDRRADSLTWVPTRLERID